MKWEWDEVGLNEDDGVPSEAMRFRRRVLVMILMNSIIGLIRNDIGPVFLVI